MLLLIWATLLFPVRGTDADTDTSVEGRQQCNNGFCITLKEGEITAEAGLCVVIPCSFTTGPGFTPEHIVWYKCEPKKKCSDSDIIFHSNPNNKKVQPDFKRRTSLLEPDLNQRNCSIIINDLIESDSGSYQLRLNGFHYKWGGGSWYTVTEGFTYSPKAAVSVKDLMQKPTMMIPPLTEGQQTTLSCTAPGLCSGSDPKITWMWGGTGLNNSHITGNITDFQTENLTAVRQRHSSTLTFNPSAEHHGTTVTCQVSFTGDTTTEETVTLNVTFFPRIFENSGCVVRSEVLTCVCISQGLPLPTIKWPLLKEHTEYSVITIVSNHTVNSTLSLTAKDYRNTVVECVSSNENGEVQKKINIVISHMQEGPVQQDAAHCAALPWAVAAVSLIVNVTCIICLVLLWNSRKKVKPNQEDRTYMSLKKTEQSPEYDVIGQPLN